MGGSGWGSGKRSAEAGFGYGLTSLIIQSDFIAIDSKNNNGVRKKIEYKDVDKKFKSLETKEIKPSIHPPDSIYKGNRETKISIRGKKGCFEHFWKYIDNWVNEGGKKYATDMIHEMILWHSAIGFTGVMMGTKKSNEIKYSLDVQFSKGGKYWNRSGIVGHPMKGWAATKGLSEITYPITKTPGPKDLIIDRKTQMKKYMEIPYSQDEFGNPVKMKTVIRGYTMAPVHPKGITAIDQMRAHMPEYPMKQYDSNRFFLSINGYPQSITLPLPSKGTTIQSNNNSIILVELAVKEGGQVLDSGRNKLANGIDSYVGDKLQQVLINLQKAQQGQKTTTHYTLHTIVADAIKHKKSNPLNSSWPSLSITAKPRLKDENFVGYLLGELVGKGLVTEIRPINIGHGHDTYDLIFFNEIPSSKLPPGNLKEVKGILKGNKKQLAKLKAGKANLFELLPENPWIGELKTYSAQYTKDVDSNISPKSRDHVRLLVCWNMSEAKDHGKNWVLTKKKIGDGFVRCTNYTLTYNVGAAPAEIEVLCLEDYINEFSKFKPKKKKKWPPF